MNWKLYNEYGNYNLDGYWISDYNKWHYYAKNPKEYKRAKFKAFLWLLIPVCGFVGLYLAFEEMGLSIL